jgi:hypothetical protein
MDLAFALSFQRLKNTKRVSRQYRLDQLQLPCPPLQPMTEIWKIAFRSVFQVAEFGDPDPIIISCDDLVFTLRQIGVFFSPAHALDFTEGDDYMVSCVVSVSTSSGSPVEKSSVVAAYGGAAGKIRLLNELGLTDLTSSMQLSQDRIMGHNAWLRDSVSHAQLDSFLAIYSFYAYGWILLMRMEREQMFMALGQSKLQSSGKAIVRQRLRILNFVRFFLTDDRTNVSELKQFCDDMRARSKYDKRYSRIADAHKDFEHHLDNTAKLAQSRQLGSVSNLIFVLTLFSVPISFFSAALALNFNSPVFEKTMETVVDTRIYVLLGIGAILVLVPFAVFWLFDLMRHTWIRLKGL